MGTHNKMAEQENKLTYILKQKELTNPKQNLLSRPDWKETDKHKTKVVDDKSEKKKQNHEK